MKLLAALFAVGEISETNMKTKIFQLHYHISNGGDGSASVHFHKTAKEAADADEKMSEDGEGWGESCNGSETLKFEDGKLYRSEFGYLDKDGNLVDDEADDFDYKKYKPGTAWIEITPDVAAKRRFEFSEGTSNKFYEIAQDGKNVIRTYGKIGTDGKTQTDTFPSDDAAKAEVAKLIAEKVGKGYKEIAD